MPARNDDVQGATHPSAPSFALEVKYRTVGIGYAAFKHVHLNWLCGNASPSASVLIFGAAPCVRSQGKADALVLSYQDRLFFIKFKADAAMPLGCKPDVLRNLLCSDHVRLAAFDGAVVVLLVHYSLNLHATALDIGSTAAHHPLVPSRPKSPYEVVAALLDVGLRARLRTAKLLRATPAEPDMGKSFVATAHLALQSRELLVRLSEDMGRAQRLDTRLLGSRELRFLGRCAAINIALHVAKPKRSLAEFSSLVEREDGTFDLRNEHYASKIAFNSRQGLELRWENGASVRGRVGVAHGKTSNIQLKGKPAAPVGEVLEVTVHGREGKSGDEEALARYYLHILQGNAEYDRAGFLRLLLFDETAGMNSVEERAVTRKMATADACAMKMLENSRLNDSQRSAARAIVQRSVSPKDRLLLIHGPPGTGKSTVISAAADAWLSSQATSHRGSVYACCQSNVAVKNIAESLVSKKVDFRIVISLNFHFEWHEHLYGKLEGRVIVTDKLDDRADLGRLLDVLAHAPSVFEIPHLRARAHFLDTQYRLPAPLVSFISSHVYKGNLASGPDVRQDEAYLALVDVSRANEEKVGTSTWNLAEVATIVHLIRDVYRHRNIWILSAYDSQRNALERALKQANLPWEDRVFNVDSFQGRENDIIIISLVRTAGLGFLNNKRRTNVMLTRATNAMVIVANRVLLETKGASTLVGKLAGLAKTMF